MMSSEERLKLLTNAVPNSWMALSRDQSTVVGRGTFREASDMAEESGELHAVLIMATGAGRSDSAIRAAASCQ
jgi:hypothetical protein